MSHPRAGKPALPEDLIDVASLVTAYYTRKPDPAVVEQQVAFGTSGHRGTSFKTSFNEDHILATTQAICDYRQAQGFDGPLFIGRDTHGLSEPAWASACIGERLTRVIPYISKYIMMLINVIICTCFHIITR